MTHPGPRRIAIVASGSVGDVRPYAVLAGAFARAGWDAGLVANDGYEGMARALGVGWFAPALPALEGIIAWQRRVHDGATGLFDAALWDSWFGAYPALVAALRGATVVASRIPFVADAARMVGAAYVPAPNLPRRGLRGDLPHVGIHTPIAALVRRQASAKRLPGGLPLVNLATRFGEARDTFGLLWRERRSLRPLAGLQQRHRAAMQAAAEGPAEAARLAARPVPPLTVVTALSRHVLPEAPGEGFTGLWRSEPPAGYGPPPALARLLESGPPPVFIGFGSCGCMPDGSDFTGLSQVVASAVRRAGVRAILQPGWGGLGWPSGQAPPEDVVVLDGTPHEWLFRRLAAVVHHCGAGTTLAALSAGLPSVALPFLQDMPFWAWRLHALGVAPPPLHPDRVTPEALAGAIRQTLDDPGLRARAAAIGTALQAEDGLGTAIRRVETRLATTTGEGRRDAA